MGFDGLTFQVVFEHASGEYWLGWAYVLEHMNPSGHREPRPELCIKVETKVGYDGRVQRVGLDLRQEGLETPLIWFERVASTE